MEAGKKEIVIARLFSAPRAMVYRAWTDPVQFAKWWGPDGYEISVCEFDVRPGGALKIDMSGAGGWLMRMDGQFIEVVENEKLKFTTTAFNDENGIPSHEHINSVSFGDENGQTKVLLTVEVVKVPEGAAATEGLSQGWRQSFDKLEQVFDNQ